MLNKTRPDQKSSCRFYVYYVGVQVFRQKASCSAIFVANQRLSRVRDNKKIYSILARCVDWHDSFTFKHPKTPPIGCGCPYFIELEI